MAEGGEPRWSMPAKGEWPVLRFIIQWPETPPTQIGQDLFKPATTVSAICQSLAIKGLITYNGKRRQPPVATERGRALALKYPEGQEPSFKRERADRERNPDPRCQRPDKCRRNPDPRNPLCQTCSIAALGDVNLRREIAALRYIARQPFGTAKMIAYEIGSTHSQATAALRALRERRWVQGRLPFITSAGVAALAADQERLKTAGRVPEEIGQ